MERTNQAELAKCAPTVVAKLESLRTEVADLIEEISEKVDKVVDKINQTSEWDSCGLQVFVKTTKKVAGHLKFEHKKLTADFEDAINNWKDLLAKA